MHSIRFWHGAAMATIVVSALLLVTGLGLLAGGAPTIQAQGALIAIVLGAVALAGASWYLWTTLDEAELPDKAPDEIKPDVEE